jgi:hypothetical protein
MRCVQIIGSDDRMDCRDMFYDPLNPLRRKCATCGFPDLDHVPQPYVLVKSRTMTPNELALAENGNFFIRERIRRVLEVVAPGQCSYFPTCYKGTTRPTPWLLAVPKHQVVTGRVKAAISRCKACAEPRSAHPGTQWSEHLFINGDSDYDVIKSATWGSSERGWDQWISRDLFLSIRLFQLLRKIKARGFYELACEEPTPPDQEESEWIKEKLLVLEANGISCHAEGTLSSEDAKWLRHYIKSHSRKARAAWDIKALERRLKTKLPRSYVDFVSAVGPASFANVDEQEGFTASILTPGKLRLQEHADDSDDDESRAVNALMFAMTGHGDYFCFDVQKGKKEFAVLLFKHEYNSFEPYAENFAACIKRFAGGGASGKNAVAKE